MFYNNFFKVYDLLFKMYNFMLRCVCWQFVVEMCVCVCMCVDDLRLECVCVETVVEICVCVCVCVLTLRSWNETALTICTWIMRAEIAHLICVCWKRIWKICALKLCRSVCFETALEMCVCWNFGWNMCVELEVCVATVLKMCLSKITVVHLKQIVVLQNVLSNGRNLWLFANVY